MPNINPSPITYEGVFGADDRRQINGSFEQQLISNVVPVQLTNPTSATDLMTATLQARTLNAVGEGLEIFGAGVVNLTTTTSAATFAVKLGGVTIASFTTGSFAVGAINLGWNFTLTATVASVDAFGNITLETHGALNASLTTAAGSITAYNDTNVAVSSSIAAATPLLLEVTGLLAAGNAASFIAQRQLLVELLN